VKNIQSFQTVAFESAVSSKTSIEQNSDFSALLLPDLVDKTALIKSLKEPEDKIGEPSPIRGNTFSHLSLEDFKETGDETFAWESFEKKLSAYSFLKCFVN
jgi:hypothetical protein